MRASPVNETTLTDLVSNTVGILVLTTLVSAMQVKEQKLSVKVPIEADSRLRPRFFICRNDRIIELDLGTILTRLAGVAGQRDLPARRDFDLQYHGLRGRHRGGNLELRAGSSESWTDLPALRSGVGAARALAGMDPETEFAYFFVYDEDPGSSSISGVAVFQAAREVMAAGARAGWRLLQAGEPVVLCEWIWKAECQYRPSIRIDGQEER